MTEFGPMTNPRLYIFEDDDHTVKYWWQIFFKTVDEGEFCTAKIQSYLEQLRPSSSFKVCPGIKEYPEEVRFQTKNLRQWGIPFNRLDSSSCELWHIPNNTHHPAGDKLRDTCYKCRLLQHDINSLAVKAQALPEEQKLLRVSVQSNYPIKYLSPASRAVRMNRVCRDRSKMVAKLAKVAHFDVDINDKQHTELLELVRSINNDGNEAIDELCSEGDCLLGDNNPLREVWYQDVIERLEYDKDQRKSGIYLSLATCKWCIQL